MKAWIKGTFAFLVVVLFGAAAFTTLWDVWRTPDFVPNSGQTYLLDAAGAAIVAFIAAQIGISISSQGGTFSARVKTSMGSSSAWGSGLLLVDFLVFLAVGLLFVVFWLQPDLVAVADGQPPLSEAPDFVQEQALAFVAVTFAAMAALAPSA